MKTLDQINFNNKKALVRVDFNVPVNEKQEVTDDTRIKAAQPTIEEILKNHGAVILMSHRGRPKGKEEKYSLKYIVPAVEKVLGHKVNFVSDSIGPEVEEAVGKLQPGDILLLENLRFYPEETKGDTHFAKELAKNGDIYINDAFGTAHRAHASTAIVAQFFDKEHKAPGKLMEKEVKSIQKALDYGEHPITAIIGGAKVSSKIGVIENLLNKVDNLIIVGGMAYTFLKALGNNIGDSIVEDDKIDVARKILDEAKKKGVNLILPVDFVIANSFSNDAQTKFVKAGEIPEGWQGLDIGPESIKLISDIIRKSKTIIWNGPAGVFEFDNFAKGTESIGLAIGEATQDGAYSLVGGGDSVAAVQKLGLEDKISYISTGGGVLLDMLAGKELPGLKALQS
jgi:phosphoglycerate kinase